MSVGSASLSPSPGGQRRQIELPLSKAFEISLRSIKIRLARSMITAAGIVLGIAFFTSVEMSGTFSQIQKGIVAEKRAELAAGMRLSQEDMRLIAEADTGKADEQASENRLQWLSIMALVVCTVGITNAML